MVILSNSKGNVGMEKSQILETIRRMAATNDGKAPGSQKFESETGATKADWYPKYWLRWGDAIREAGCAPNTFTKSYDDEFLIQKYVQLTRELGRFPIEGDLIVKRRVDKTFPNRESFRRLGTKSERAAKIIEYCSAREGFEDVIPLVNEPIDARLPELDGTSDKPAAGYVYLLKHGSRREYKIGRTYNPMRREGEIAVELPLPLDPIHVIKTDDPVGI